MNPLVSMRWGLEALKKRLGEKAKFVEDVYLLNINMIELVDDLLKMVKIERHRFKGKEKAVNAERVVKRIIKELIYPRGKDINIKLTVSKKPLPKIYIDPFVLKEIFSNIIANALKYSPAGSPIKVKLTYNINSLIFSCRDKGFGISEKEQKYMFRKFFRSSVVKKKKIKGTGLGIYITKLFVRMYGGKIKFKSRRRPTPGSAFYVYLPLKGPHAHTEHCPEVLKAKK